MAPKVHITGEFATPADVASRLHISPSRRAELQRQMSDLQVRRSHSKVRPIVRAASAKKK